MLAQGRRWALRLGAWPARKACCTAEVDQVGEVGSGRIRACRTVDLGVRPLAARIPFSLAAPDRPTGCFRHRDILGRIRGVTIASEHYHGTAGQRSATRGAARQGKGSTVEDSNESSSGCVCINTARQKQARHHEAWQCQARRSIATRGKGVCSGKRLMGASRWKHQHGAARFGSAGRGAARRGNARQGSLQWEATYGRFPVETPTRHGKATRGVARYGQARQGEGLLGRRLATVAIPVSPNRRGSGRNG